MKVIGITGGVGCGKSRVLELISDNFNAYVIKADDVSRHILDKDTPGYHKVIEIFGEGILSENGEIDRGKLGEIVFNNRNKLMVLNSIVHPLVKKQIVEEIGRVRCEDKFDYFIVEAALLLEDHYEIFCDEVWYVYSKLDVRKVRLKESRGYTDEKINSIISNQLTEEEFRKKCHKVLDNSGTIEETLLQLKKMLVED